MYPNPRTHQSRLWRHRWRGRLSAVWPWVFVLGIAAGTMLPSKPWMPWRAPARAPSDSDEIWRRAGNPTLRHPVEVLHTIDGDTFEARVQLWPGRDLTTRVRLRGIDAPERKAGCAEEARLADLATLALRGLLDEGGVAIYNIGPDKYQGRVVADVATRRTPSVSDAMLGRGLARSYQGGHRAGWCK